MDKSEVQPGQPESHQSVDYQALLDQARIENSPAVSLDRNLPFESAYEYNPDYFYRFIGRSGYEDFLETGVLRPAADSKQDYSKAYFYKGHPLKRYASRAGHENYFVEADREGAGIVEPEEGYPYTEEPLSSDKKFRVVRVDTLTGEIQVVYDSISDKGRSSDERG